jgi:hypothetical protein
MTGVARRRKGVPAMTGKYRSSSYFASNLISLGSLREPGLILLYRAKNISVST